MGDASRARSWASSRLPAYARPQLARQAVRLAGVGVAGSHQVGGRRHGQPFAAATLSRKHATERGFDLVDNGETTTRTTRMQVCPREPDQEEETMSRRDGLFKRSDWWWIDCTDAEGQRHREKAAPSYDVAKLVYQDVVAEGRAPARAGLGNARPRNAGQHDPAPLGRREALRGPQRSR